MECTHTGCRSHPGAPGFQRDRGARDGLVQWRGAVEGCSGGVPTTFRRLLAWRKNQPHSLVESLVLISILPLAEVQQPPDRRLPRAYRGGVWGVPGAPSCNVAVSRQRGSVCQRPAPLLTCSPRPGVTSSLPPWAWLHCHCFCFFPAFSSQSLPVYCLIVSHPPECIHLDR